LSGYLLPQVESLLTLAATFKLKFTLGHFQEYKKRSSIPLNFKIQLAHLLKKKNMCSSLVLIALLFTNAFAVDPGTPVVSPLTPCTQPGTYACGPSNTPNVDSIVVCAQGGTWVHLDNCDESTDNKCALINNIPYCVAGMGGNGGAAAAVVAAPSAGLAAAANVKAAVVSPENQNQTPPPSPSVSAAAPASTGGAAGQNTPQDCKVANDFLCVTQCGKVLIHCTGPGAGQLTNALDEPQAVCNNGKIDFASNCVV
jgi:hypothetical protein